MTLNEFIDRINRAKEELPRIILASYIQTAEDANGIIQSRVQEKGINAQGTSFAQIKPYSEQYIKIKQHTTTGGKGKTRKGKKSDAAGRAIQGRYRGFVDFLLSGSMWKNTKVLVDEAVMDKSGIKISVSPINSDEVLKMEGNVSGNGKWKGRGEILELSKDELQHLAENFESTLADQFESFFR